MKPARATRSVVLLGCAALLGACTDDPEPAAESPEVDTSAPPSSGTALRADYVLNAGEAGRANIAVITGAPDQIRISWVFRGDDPVTKLLLVYDGKQLLEYGSDPGSYTLYRVPEDAEAYDHVRAWVLPPGATAWLRRVRTPSSSVTGRSRAVQRWATGATPASSRPR